MNKAEVYAITKNALISPKKVAPVMDLVRGKSLNEAKIVLTMDSTKAAAMVLKTLKSAEANAKTNNNLKPNDLFISHIQVDGAETLKRGDFTSRGHFSPILKRRSHIVVGLSASKEAK